MQLGYMKLYNCNSTRTDGRRHYVQSSVERLRAALCEHGSQIRDGRWLLLVVLFCYVVRSVVQRTNRPMV